MSSLLTVTRSHRFSTCFPFNRPASNGGRHRLLIPASALLGAALVLICDTLSRVLFAPYELPVGIFLSLLGGPFFLFLLLHKKSSREA